MAKRRPTDGRMCRECESVYFTRACPWCFRRKAHTKHPEAAQKKLAALTKRLRKLVERDGWDCWLCEWPVNPFTLEEHRASADHVIPKAQGGSNDLENLRLAHASCNEYRGGSKIHPFAPFDRSPAADQKRRGD